MQRVSLLASENHISKYNQYRHIPGIFPEQWKEANLTLEHKKGESDHLKLHTQNSSFLICQNIRENSFQKPVQLPKIKQQRTNLALHPETQVQTS